MEEIERLLGHLQFVLKVPANRVESVRIFHLSFRDFLLTKERCRKTQLRIDEKEAQYKLMDECIFLIDNCLKKDRCGLIAPKCSLSGAVTSSQVGEYIPLELQYACLYWIQHLQKSGIQLYDDC